MSIQRRCGIKLHPFLKQFHVEKCNHLKSVVSVEVNLME